MLKKLLLLSVCSVSPSLFAMQTVSLYNASIDSLEKFRIIENNPGKNVKLLHSSAEKNTLELISTTATHNRSISRFQQKYRNIPVIGSEITIVKPVLTSNTMLSSKPVVHGQITEDIQLDIHPVISASQALDLAKNAWLNTKSDYSVKETSSELQFRPTKAGKLHLVYQVSFTGIKDRAIPAAPVFIVDAETGEIIKRWNNVKHFKDTGPGGNNKVGQYWYGKDGLPALDVQPGKKGYCVMTNKKVKLVDLRYKWDMDAVFKTPHRYLCGNNQGDAINGAFSPNNDAYYFGSLIVDMYNNWYNLPALQTPEGKPMQLVMRTHFGKKYDNAFWYKNTMNFGDGEELYPLVSMDVAGHEVSHGFTEQHSNLEYHDQSGSLNESFSDMAGQVIRAYALETQPDLYNKSHLTPDKITWGMGETIMRDPAMSAIRFMNQPSLDGSSADCDNRDIAANHGAVCEISYKDVEMFARENFEEEEDQQSYIVHTGSGVFNKAFYLLAEEIGIKAAFQIMVDTNVSLWSGTTDFNKAACEVALTAHNLSHDDGMLNRVFGQVGIDTSVCQWKS